MVSHTTLESSSQMSIFGHKEQHSSYKKGRRKKVRKKKKASKEALESNICRLLTFRDDLGTRQVLKNCLCVCRAVLNCISHNKQEILHFPTLLDTYNSLEYTSMWEKIISHLLSQSLWQLFAAVAAYNESKRCQKFT